MKIDKLAEDAEVQAAGGWMRPLVGHVGRVAAVGLLWAVAFAPCRVPAEGVAGKRPNIVLILADDMGYECLGCYGSASYKTPVLDELAQNGVLFRNCHAQPLCTPSRVKIMTGKYNFRNYTEFSSLPPGQQTFANLLHEAGYATCIAGKWQLGGDKKSLAEFGFDEYCLWQLFSYPVKARGPRYADPKINQNGVVLDHTDGKYGPDVFCDFVNDFMVRKKNQPFFVYYPMVLTHTPFVPTPDSPDWNAERNKQSPAYFKDMVEYTDKLVGKIIKKLDAMGVRENTLILFVGDNGTSTQIRSKMIDGRVVKGGKGLTTDNGTHVPLIANWSGTAATGAVCDDLIGFESFLPTLVQTAGVSLPFASDGVSFLPQIRGEQGAPRDWLFMYASLKHPTVNRWASGPGVDTIEPGSKKQGWRSYVKRFVRDWRWKLYSTGHLYDLNKDLGELKPLLPAQDNPGSAAARKRLENILSSIK